MGLCGLVASYIFVQAQTLEEGEGGKGEVHLFPHDYVFIRSRVDKFWFFANLLLAILKFSSRPCFRDGSCI